MSKLTLSQLERHLFAAADILYVQVEALALKENVSIDQIVLSALSAQVSKGYLEARAKRGSWENVQRVLAKVPDVEPEEHDRL
jgi:hypothetical protein